MALKFRMQRFGNKNRPFFSVVVTDSRNARNGRFIERVGHYNPMTEPSTFSVDVERMNHWYKVGARPSDAIATLLKKTQVTLG
ncbi:30S ribosomal protein S16 [bacterium]|nr:30S ribosomal protein S16 [bacterium]